MMRRKPTGQADTFEIGLLGQKVGILFSRWPWHVIEPRGSSRIDERNHSATTSQQGRRQVWTIASSIRTDSPRCRPSPTQMGRIGCGCRSSQFYSHRMGNWERTARTQRPNLATRKTAARSWCERVASFSWQRCQIVRLETSSQRIGNVRHDFGFLFGLQSR